MATFEIEANGKRFEIEAPDAGTAMAALQKVSTPPPDPVRDTVRQEYERDRAAGVPVGAGIARRAIQGATMGAADEVIAGLSAPIEMFRRGTWSPVEGYRYAKAREDLELEEARKSQGVAGTAAEIGGAILSGSGLARGGLSAFSRLTPGAGFGARSAASAADAAAYGAVSGFNEGSGESRVSGALKGAAIGGALGGVMPTVAAVAGGVAAPVVSRVRAWANPEGLARSQVARALAESSRTGQQVADDVAIAAQEGQGVYTVADALGNPGQRMLSTVSRAPGPGRTQVTEFLDARQADQGRRVANTLSEGFAAPRTAEQTRVALTQARSADATRNYGAARSQSGAVDVTPAIAQVDETLRPGVTRVVNPQTNISDDSVEAVLRRARGYLTDGRSQVTRFDEALRAKMEIDNLIERASPTQQRALIPVRNALDDQLAATSQPYAAARNQFRRQSEAIEAIDEGRTAAMRGRTEDTIQRFRVLRADQQDAFRAGYVDPLIERVQGSAFGANKAREFTSDAFRAESQAVAPLATGTQMARRIARENTMFETRNHALGNSRTADNIADQGAMQVDPTLLASLLAGNWGGAIRQLGVSGHNALSGYTPAVREAIAEILLSRGQNARNLAPILDEAVRRSETVRLLLGDLARGAYAGTAMAPSATGQRSR